MDIKIEVYLDTDKTDDRKLVEEIVALVKNLQEQQKNVDKQ